ncbi:hypothetical protein FZD47_25310 [Bacillus infantis]|jgi:hypothetical protein|uniref:Phage tail protein n=1 Tax=Bacillus infantis TaxID=324767 RepID=A0A5D4RYJ7_9BACI|nr:hypothetical protein [Bacillus infantis]TYS55749.1 hypothetical protein FZD47_25310 [Bacillus infantis]
MAKDGLLGKDLSITYIRRGGAPFRLETDKFDEEMKTDEKTKHPIGEPSEHSKTIIKGWELSVEGEVVDTIPDDLMYEIEQAYNNGKPMPEIEVTTEEVYEDGTIRKWRFYSQGGVRISGYKKTAAGGADARKWSFKITAQKRERI